MPKVARGKSTTEEAFLLTVPSLFLCVDELTTAPGPNFARTGHVKESSTAQNQGAGTRWTFGYKSDEFGNVHYVDTSWHRGENVEVRDTPENMAHVQSTTKTRSDIDVHPRLRSCLLSVRTAPPAHSNHPTLFLASSCLQPIVFSLSSPSKLTATGRQRSVAYVRSQTHRHPKQHHTYNSRPAAK